MDGRTTPAATATVTVAVTSAPLLTAFGSTTEDTYGRREIIEIEVTASEAVEVIGDPEFRFTIGTDPVRAAYDRGSSATRLVFTYTVQAGDMDGDGIEIGDGSTTFELDSNDRIRTVAHRIDIDSSHTAPGTLTGHRVDGSEIADDRDPELEPDGAKVFTDQLTLTYDEPLDGGSVPAKEQFKVSLDGGTAQAVSAVAVDGSTVTLTLARPAVFGQEVTLTYTVPATNPLQDLFGNDAGALTNHLVENKTIVLPVVSIAAVHPKAAPLLADAAVPAVGVAGPGGGPRGDARHRAGGGVSREHGADRHDSGGPDHGNPDVPHCRRLHPRVRWPDRHGHGRRALYLPALAPANAATVQVVVVNPPIVAQWAENAYTVAEGEDATATLTLKTAAGMPKVPKPRADYKVRVFTTNHTAVTADDFTAVDVELTVRPGDWTADGAVFAVSVPVTVETVDDSLLEGDERFYLQVGRCDRPGSARARVRRRA